VPAHRIGKPIVDVEQVGDVNRIAQRLIVHAGRANRCRVVASQRVGFQRHLLQEAQRRSQLWPNRRGLEVVQHLARDRGVESNRRDRGVCVGSIVAVIDSRDERREQLALADRPRRWPAHHGVSMLAMMPAEIIASIGQRSGDVRRPESRPQTNHCEPEAIRKASAAFDRSEPHASPSITASADINRCSAAPIVAATITSNN
jgi:hypothetical protein